MHDRPNRLLILMVFAAFAIAGCGMATEPRIVATQVPLPTLAPTSAIPAEHLVAGDASRGAQVFAENCTACHGVAGLGDGPSVISGAIPKVPNFSDPTTLTTNSAEMMYQVITDGRLDKYMPPWGGILTEEQRWSVAEYVYSLTQGSEAVIASSPQTNPVPLPETLGVISGTVTHGTAGMTVPDGLSVALQTLTVDFEEVGFEMGTVTQGAYSFENVSMREDRLFVITLIYNGTVFSSQFLIGDPAAPEQAIPLTIYEATTDPTVVEIDLLVTRIEKQHEEIVFTEIVNFRNTSDRLFQRTINGRDQAGHLQLPTGAQLLNEAELLRCCVVEDGILYDLEPLLPGADHMIRAVYTLSEGSSPAPAYTLDYRMTNQLELMLSPGVFTLEAEGFRGQGIQQFSTGAYEIYLADPPAPSEVIRYRLSDAPVPTALPSMPVMLAMAGLVLMIGSGLIGWRFSRSAAAMQHGLLEKIARLDARYQAGKVQRGRYERDRQRLKVQLGHYLNEQTPS